MRALRRSVRLGAHVLALLLLRPDLAGAHPHVWVKVECDVALNEDDRPTALTQRWTFDAMYSSYALYGLDRDGDGRFSAEELAPLVETMKTSMRDDAYFTRVAMDGATVALSPPTAQALTVAPNGDLVMSFTQDFREVASLKSRSLRIEVRDIEYYVDFAFAKASFATLAPPRPGCVARLDDGQPPPGASPDDLMNALIRGPIQTLSSGVVIRCD